MKLWLDDVRPAPSDDWLWVKTVEEAKAALEVFEITEASLDHDLGYVADPNWDGDPREPQEIALTDDWRGDDGIELVRWMCETGTYPTQAVVVHSGNPPAARNMADTLRAANCPCVVAIRPFRV